MRISNYVRGKEYDVLYRGSKDEAVAYWRGMQIGLDLAGAIVDGYRTSVTSDNHTFKVVLGNKTYRVFVSHQSELDGDFDDSGS